MKNSDIDRNDFTREEIIEALDDKFYFDSDLIDMAIDDFYKGLDVKFKKELVKIKDK